MKFFFLLFISSLQIVHAERAENFQMDWKYTGGKYLIFDCERSHYACVNKEGQDNCLEERKYALEIKAKSYPCAPLRVFSDQVACIKESYKIVDIGANKRFCFPK